MFRIDDQLKELLESGVAVVLGTSDADNRPHCVYAWGLRVLEGGCRAELFLEAPRADVHIADLEATRRIAVTVADPVSYRSVQLKGTFAGACPAAPEDEPWVQRHRQLFETTTALVGDPRPSIRNLWMEEAPLVRIGFEVDGAFDQTPGPEAGRPL